MALVKWTVPFPLFPPEHLVPMARAAEEAGFDTIAMPDSVFFPEQVSADYPYSADGGRFWTPETPFVDPFVAFGAIASRTSTLELLCNVYVLPLRHLFVAAKQVSSIAVMSGGRFVLGTGIGWLREEFEAAGASFATRGARTDEMLDLLEQLLTGAPVAADGAHHRFAELRIAPVPATRVPVLVGGTSSPALARAARADGWIGVNHEPDELFAILDRLHAARAAAGTTARSYEIVVSRPGVFDASVARRYAAAGVTGVVNRPTSGSVGADAPIAAHERAMREFVELVAG